MSRSSELLQEIEHYLKDVVALQAMALDRDPTHLHHILQEMGNHHWLALKIPQKWGGYALDDFSFRQFQEQISRYSGTLAFLQTQHQSAASMLANSPNEALKYRYLPHMASGATLMGVGFSQLRRSGPPMVQAEPLAAGYQLQGEVPWITGFGCFQHVIVAAILPKGEAVFGIVPFQAETQPQGGTISFSDPLPLTAMAATNTVTGHLEGWVLRTVDVVDIKPAGWIQDRDQRQVLHHSFFALGCAQAGLDIMAAAQWAFPAFVAESLRSLTTELEHCRTAIYEAQAAPHRSIDRLSLRAWAIGLAVRCAQAAVAVSRGAANHQHHPAQRVYREALAFTVFGQTTAVMEATLTHLTRATPFPPS